MMEIGFYVIIFIVGSLIGSWYATILQRMYKNQRVLSIHTYCPNCGKELKFFEKIPILSYIFLRGRCKNCKKTIESQYILLETITGILFVIAAYGVNLISSFNITNLISFIFIILYLSYIILTIGLDKKNKKTSASILAFGIIIALVYMVYLCTVDNVYIYKNIVLLVIMICLLLLNIISTKKRAQSSYSIDLLTMLLVMVIFTQEMICIITIIGTLLAIAFNILISKIKEVKVKGQKSNKMYNPNIRVAFIMGTLNIIMFFTFLICANLSK